MDIVNLFENDIILSGGDLLAFLWFFACWIGYIIFTDKNHHRSLFNTMRIHRMEWMKTMMRRTDRIIDSRVVESLSQSVTFFASTSIFIIAGLISLISYSGKANLILGKFSPVLKATPALWEFKTALLIMIFIYVFFKYTWALRQLNYASVLVVAAPLQPDNVEWGGEYKKCGERLESLLSNAVRHFTSGIRGYYFGLAALSWYIHYSIFMGVTIWIVLVLYRREFMSRALSFLAN